MPPGKLQLDAWLAPGSVVVPGLQEVNAVIADQVDDAMFLREAPGPGASSNKLEGFRLADAAEGIAHDGFDEVESAQCDPSIGVHPEPEIFAKLGVEDGDARGALTRVPLSFPWQGRAPAEGLRWI